MITVVGAICLVMLPAAALIAAVFVVRARNLVDRAVGLDTAVAVLLNGMAVGVAVAGGGNAINLVLLIGLLAFLGTIAVARFIERRGAGATSEDRHTESRPSEEPS